METFIDNLLLDDTQKKLLTRIFQNNMRRGIFEFSERDLILKNAVSYLGYSYLRTEELNRATIDCSTLVSQSYWEGAILGIPFIAESQRTAKDGVPINASELLPGDIVIKYPSLNDAPDKTYNHVGLILGQVEEITYVIESNSNDGCIVSTLEKFNPLGGFRRYIKNEDVVVNANTYKKIHELAKSVPKLSRLGARQYCKNPEETRILHLGIDIYIPQSTLVKCPIDGILTFAEIANEYSNCALIVNKEMNLECVLGNITKDSSLENTTVNAGDIIGEVVMPNKYSHIDYPEISGNMTHLHFQVMGNLDISYIPNMISTSATNYYNGLYLAKMGTIELPV